MAQAARALKPEQNTVWNHADMTREALAGLQSHAKAMAVFYDSKSFDRFWGLFRGIATVLWHHGAPIRVIVSVGRSVLEYLYPTIEETFIKRAKWLVAFPNAKFLGNPLPEAPDEALFKFSGDGRRWLKARFHRYHGRNIHLFFSWFQCKRACLQMSDDEALRVLKSHSASMSRTDPLPVNRREIYLTAVRPLLVNLNGELRKVLGDKVAPQSSTRQPSLSASFEKTRSQGGQQAALREVVASAQAMYEDSDLESQQSDNGDGAPYGGYDEYEDEWYEPLVGESYVKERKFWIDSPPESKVWTVEDQRKIQEINSDWLDRDHRNRYSDEVSYNGKTYPAFWMEEKVLNPLTGRYISSYSELQEEPCTELHSIREKAEARLQTVLTNYTDLDAWTSRDYSHFYSGNDRESHIFKTAVRESVSGPLEAQIAMVFEPLKVRVISKGPAASYYVATGFQKKIHGLMRRMPCFRLIGRPASPTDLQDIVRNDKLLSRLELYSADYVTSTDRLSSGLSGDFMELLTEGLKYAEVYKATLRPHKISYPIFRIRRTELGDFIDYLMTRFNPHGVPEIRKNLLEECINPNAFPGVANNQGLNGRSYFVKVRLPSIMQENGQLMGSVTSFPVLCLGNLAGWLVSMCIVHRLEDILERDATPDDEALLLCCFESFVAEYLSVPYIAYLMDKVLINGDDLLALMSPAEQLVFTWVGKEIGLELSVGKTYSHSRYANINSTCYDFNFRHGSVPVEIPYLNTGLFFGQNKVLCSTDTDGDEIRLATVAPHVVVVDRVVEGALPGKQCDLLAAYLSLWKRELPAECRGRNLFISRSLGGFGVKVPVGWNWTVTATQKCFAESCLKKLGDYEPDQRPNFYMDREFEPVAYIAPWWDRRESATVPPRLPRAHNSGIGIVGVDLTLNYRSILRPPCYTGVPTFWVSPDTAMRDFEL